MISLVLGQKVLAYCAQLPQELGVRVHASDFHEAHPQHRVPRLDNRDAGGLDPFVGLHLGSYQSEGRPPQASRKMGVPSALNFGQDARDRLLPMARRVVSDVRNQPT